MPCFDCGRPLFIDEPSICRPCRVTADTRLMRITQTEWAYRAFWNYLRVRQMMGR